MRPCAFPTDLKDPAMQKFDNLINGEWLAGASYSAEHSTRATWPTCSASTRRATRPR